MKHKNKIKSLLAAAALSVVGTYTSDGYFAGETKWPFQSTINLDVSCPSDKFNQAVQDAANAWNAVIRDTQFVVNLLPPAQGAPNDSHNSVFFSNTLFDGSTFGAGTVALTYTVTKGSDIIESDTIINNAFQYDVYDGPTHWVGNTFILDLRRVATHELGHALGLDHPNDHGQTVVAIMNSAIGDIDRLQPDDIAGAQFLYGNPAQPVEPTKIINISTRGFVGTGDKVMISGFIIQGSGSKKVIIRGLGPTLANFGVTGVLSNPVLELHDANGALMDINDDWQSNPNASEITQDGFAPSNTLESVLIRDLPAGHYTAILKGLTNTTGNGLIEVYILN